MIQSHRETATRGTPDLPFALYSFHFAAPRLTAANTHWHPEQEILYVKAGSLEVLIGRNAYIVKESQICFIPPNALHSVITNSPDTVYYALVFSYELLTLPDSHFFQIGITEPLKSGRFTFPTILSGEDPHFPAAEMALEQVCRCDKAMPNYKFVIFQALIALYSSLQDTLVPVGAVKNTADNQAVKTCLDYMQTHYRQRITLDQLAQLVHLHPNYLCKLFKTYTGQTAFQLLTRIRLENAAELLDKSGCSVSQAANLCGFESVSFFSRKFKQIMNCAPKKYSTHSKKESY